jgi:transposase
MAAPLFFHDIASSQCSCSTAPAGFLRLVSHFPFEPHFRLVRRPDLKGHVEGLLGDARRNVLAPAPRVNDLETVNAELDDPAA